MTHCGFGKSSEPAPRTLVEERNRVAQQLEKIPQDARIKSAGGPGA
jgi:hypothetical protein